MKETIENYWLWSQFDQGKTLFFNMINGTKLPVIQLDNEMSGDNFIGVELINGTKLLVNKSAIVSIEIGV